MEKGVEVYCEGDPENDQPQCDHYMPASYPARDMCAKHPRLEGFGYVRKSVWDNFPPFLFCINVNGGICYLYEPKREGKADAQNE